MMTSFLDVQRILDRALGPASAGNHGAFWRGKTRDEFVDLEVFGLGIISKSDPEGSLLVRALEGNMPKGGQEPSLLCLGTQQPAATAADIETVSTWIAAGCPDVVARDGLAAAAAVVDDTTHVEYWRSIDYFFLPSLASVETRKHVERLHMHAFGPWKASKVVGDANDPWAGYIANDDVQASFEHVRFHQRRLINQYYGTSQDDIFDSLWKFGGNLLPLDPQLSIPPNRTMNSPFDWFWWIPYLELSLTAADMNDTDLHLGRAWQVGIVADGLIRQRLEIPDFDANDPNLEPNVKAAFATTEAGELVNMMTSRASRFAHDPGFPFPSWPRP